MKGMVALNKCFSEGCEEKTATEFCWRCLKNGGFKMPLTKEHLKTAFKKAKEESSYYVFVSIVADGIEEVIVIPNRSFEAKEKFYLSAYDDDLKHVMNKQVFIKGLSYGSAYELDNIL